MTSNNSTDPRPPTAVFDDPFTRRSRPEPVDLDVQCLRAALVDVEGFAPTDRRVAALSRVATRASECGEWLGSRLDGLADEPEARSPVQRYFGTRTATLPSDRALWHCVRVIAEAAADLVETPLQGSDLQRVAVAMATVLQRFTTTCSQSPPPSSPGPRSPRGSDEDMWLRRWIVGHQVHAMLNVHAAHALAEAAEALRADATHHAATALDQATDLVAGFAAARAHALAVPARFYQDVLRPSMLPPLTEVPLSGRMHVEYRGYRQRLSEIMELLPQSSTELARSHLPLMLARERLLEADLIEAERHVTSIEPLVGDARSLIQTGRSVDNAVSALRRIRHRRAARAAPFLRYPATDAAHQDGTHQEQF